MAGAVQETAILKKVELPEQKRQVLQEPVIRKGPVEGLLIVDGRPQVERADMPTISFESIMALMKLNEGQDKKD